MHAFETSDDVVVRIELPSMPPDIPEIRPGLVSTSVERL